MKRRVQQKESSDEEEQDACNVCDGDKSTQKNPIIFCDGKGCNMPVHKRCYNVKTIPEDDWYCQRCENKRKKKGTNIICCPMQTGAIKKTVNVSEQIHVVCAMWNPKIKEEIEPYELEKSFTDFTTLCYLCDQSKGFTVGCEEADCETQFHVTCGINNGLIIPAVTVPLDYSFRCGEHQTTQQPITKRKVAIKKNNKRRLRQLDSDQEEESEGESGSESESDSVVQEEEEEEEEGSATEEEEEGDNYEKSKRRKTTNTNGDDRITSSPAGIGIAIKKQVPSKRHTPSLESLFSEDQSSDDDDMGSSSSKKRVKHNNNHNRLAITTAATTTATSTNSGISSTSTTPRPEETSTSFRARFEAKRNKAPTPILNRQQQSVTPPMAAGVTQKNKLPNMASGGIANNNGATSTNRHSITPPMKKTNGPGIIQNIDQLQNNAIQRFGTSSAPSSNNSNSSGNNTTNNNSVTPLQHPQPTTPHGNTTMFFDIELMKNNINHSHRKSVDNWKMVNGEEVQKLREEVKKYNDFKKMVSEIFNNLNVPVPGAPSPLADVENYVLQLQQVLRRAGPIREHEKGQLQEIVKNAMNINNIIN